MTIELVLLCHAATRAMKTGVFPTGDEPVEPLADAAAAALAVRRATQYGEPGEPSAATRVIASSARAARETALWLSATSELNDGFGDLDHGRWRGRALREVHDAEPQNLMAWLSDPASAAHGGESLEDLSARVWCALEALATAEPRRTVIATHAIVLKVALARVLGAPLTSVYAMDFEPLSTLVLRHSAGAWRVLHRAPA